MAGLVFLLCKNQGPGSFCLVTPPLPTHASTHGPTGL